MGIADRRFDGLAPGPSNYFARELEHIILRAAEEEIPNLNFSDVFTVSTEVDPGSVKYTNTMFSQLGQAEIVADFAADLPLVDAAAEQESFNVKFLADKYMFSIQEIKAAAKVQRPAGMGLPQRRATAAKTAIMQKHNRIAWNGALDAGLYGFLNYPDIPRVTLSYGINSTATGDQIIAQIFDMRGDIFSVTQGTFWPELFGVGPDEYAYLYNTRYTTEGVTLAQYITNTAAGQGRPCKIVGAWELGLGNTNNSSKFCGWWSAKDVTYHIPGGEAFEQLDPQYKNLAQVIPCYGISGGIAVEYPLHMVLGVLPS